MTDLTRKDSRPAVSAPAGNTATGILKLLALVFMFVDHSGKVLFNNMTEMRTIGRIAFPLYIWCMIVGFYRTRNVSRYLIRIMLVGLVSQPLYLFALDYELHLGTLWDKTFLPLANGFSFPALWEVLYTIFLAKPNIFLTLLMGLMALCAVREEHWLRKAWIPALFLAALTVFNMLHDKAFDPILARMAAPFENGVTFEAVGAFLKTMFWDTPNYFFLIFLGGSLLWKFSGKGRRMGQVWGPVAMILLATILKADYGWRAIVFFLLIYAVRGSRPGLAAVFTSFLLFWGTSYSITGKLLNEKIDLNLLPDSLSAGLSDDLIARLSGGKESFGGIPSAVSGNFRVVNGYRFYDGPVPSLLRSETYALLGLPLILIRFPKDLRLPKWLSYLLYPGHLVILIVLKIILYGW